MPGRAGPLNGGMPVPRIVIMGLLLLADGSPHLKSLSFSPAPFRLDGTAAGDLAGPAVAAVLAVAEVDHAEQVAIGVGEDNEVGVGGVQVPVDAPGAPPHQA